MVVPRGTVPSCQNTDGRQEHNQAQPTTPTRGTVVPRGTARPCHLARGLVRLVLRSSTLLRVLDSPGLPCDAFFAILLASLALNNNNNSQCESRFPFDRVVHLSFLPNVVHLSFSSTVFLKISKDAAYVKSMQKEADLTHP